LVYAAVDWGFIWAQAPELARGLEHTLTVAAIGVAGACIVGVVLGAVRAHRVPVASRLAAVYVEVIRNTPILVQIFFLFYGLPQVGIVLSPFTTAWLAVLIWGGAFNVENFRAGFEAVSASYREAGYALGFGPVRTFFSVTLPIGGRIALPSSINTNISVLKNTSLLTAIGYAELTNVARSFSAATFRDSEMLIVIAGAYLVLVWTLSASIRLLEARLRLPEVT
jgi:His/Glu/Gln/Arg/opine family amino acid ABC transporter permease subunit